MRMRERRRHGAGRRAGGGGMGSAPLAARRGARRRFKRTRVGHAQESAREGPTARCGGASPRRRENSPGNGVHSPEGALHGSGTRCHGGDEASLGVMATRKRPGRAMARGGLWRGERMDAGSSPTRRSSAGARESWQVVATRSAAPSGRREEERRREDGRAELSSTRLAPPHERRRKSDDGEGPGRANGAGCEAAKWEDRKWCGFYRRRRLHVEGIGDVGLERQTT